MRVYRGAPALCSGRHGRQLVASIDLAQSHARSYCPLRPIGGIGRVGIVEAAEDVDIFRSRSLRWRGSKGEEAGRE